MMNIHRPDWRMVVAIVAALVAALIWSNIAAQNNEAAKQQSIGALISYVQRQDREFNADRSVLLADQGLLLTYTRTLADREEALLAYLRQHGVRLPQRLITEIPPPVLIRVPAAEPSSAPPVSSTHGPKKHGKGKKK